MTAPKIAGYSKWNLWLENIVHRKKFLVPVYKESTILPSYTEKKNMTQ